MVALLTSASVAMLRASHALGGALLERADGGAHSKSVFGYYMHVWNVFYACYALICFLH